MTTEQHFSELKEYIKTLNDLINEEREKREECNKRRDEIMTELAKVIKKNNELSMKIYGRKGIKAA